jgi:hypothetical protein
MLCVGDGVAQDGVGTLAWHSGHACSQEVEAGGWRTLDQPGLQGETASKKSWARWLTCNQLLRQSLGRSQPWAKR